MRKTATDSGATDALIPARRVAIPTARLAPLLESYLLDGKYQMKSARYLADQKKLIHGLLLPFLKSLAAETCGRAELRAFLIHTREGRNNAKGKPCSEATVSCYYRSLRAFFAWLALEGALDRSPFADMAPPKVPKKPVIPFRQEQIEALLSTAARSRHSRRDTALLLMLLDTGLRVSELVSLTVGDVDLSQRRTLVRGKGGKEREVYWSPITARALLAYLREREEPDPAEPLWTSERGRDAGAGLTDWGVRQIVERIAKAAGVEGVRCSPHTFRHTFALEFLTSGGNQFDLVRLLGHEDITVTTRYVNQAASDVQAAHSRFSPVMGMVGKKKR